MTLFLPRSNPLTSLVLSQNFQPKMNSKTPQSLGDNSKIMDDKTSPSAGKPKINSVIDEINRGKQFARLLEQRQTVGVKSVYEKATEEQYKKLYPDVYVEKMIVPDYAPNYDDCRHIRRNVINRNALNMAQHINLLAQPRSFKQREVDPPYIVKRKVIQPSHRVLQLARPKKRQALETCKRYGATMQTFCIENCHRNIQEVTFVPIRDAVYFIKLNKRKPLIEKQKQELRMKRLQETINEARMAQMHQLLRKLYKQLKESLLDPLEEAVTKDTHTFHLKNVLRNKFGNLLVPRVEKDIAKDARTVQLNSVVQGRLENFLKRTAEKKDKIYLDQMLEHLSGKLAIWLKGLLSSKTTETDVTTTKVTEHITTSGQQITTESNVVSETVTNKSASNTNVDP